MTMGSTFRKIVHKYLSRDLIIIPNYQPNILVKTIRYLNNYSCHHNKLKYFQTSKREYNAYFNLIKY